MTSANSIGARKVVDESDEEVVEVTKTAAKSAPKKKKADEPVKGVETTASDYFASSKTTPKKAAPKAAPKPSAKTEIEIRVSPRKKEAPAPAPAPASATRKRGTATFKNYKMDDDDEFEDGPDGGDDIFAADAKRGKRKNDDYVDDDEEDEEEDFAPKPKRVASRSTKAAPISLDTESDDDVKPATDRKSVV